MKNVYIIGSGKIGCNITIALNKSNIKILGIHSRNQKTGNKLANRVNSIYFEKFVIPEKTELIIICVPDDEIKNIAKKIKKTAVIHTAGCSDIALLKNCSNNHGVVWPIQTFLDNKKANLKNVPICIEANNTIFEEKLKSLFSNISNNIMSINLKQRQLIHLSAVFSCNFSNYLYSIAEEILSKDNLDFSLLKPLILETTNNAFKFRPKNNQTGPAKRKDLGTIKKHLDLLSLNEKKEYLKIYNLITNNIIKAHES